MSEIKNEVQTVLPIKEEIEAWINSDSGKKTYLTMFAIDLADHGLDQGIKGGLSSLYYDPEVAKLCPEEQYQWLKDQMPIEDIRHAAYIPESDTIILSAEDEFLSRIEASSVEHDKRLERAVKKGHNIYTGMSARIKETGWRIFVIRFTESRMWKKPELSPIKALTISGLAKNGYLILRPSWSGEDIIGGKFDWLPSDN